MLEVARSVAGTIGSGVAFVCRRWGFWMAFAAGVAATVMIVDRRIYESLLQGDEYQVDLGSLRVCSRPGWAAGIPGTDVNIGLRGKRSIFDRDLARQVADEIAKNPWVARVARVEKILPNKIRVAYELRRPVAAVPTRQGFVLVDRYGIRLPGVYPEVPRVGAPIGVLRGVGSAPPEPGRAWEDHRVTAGLSMVAVLSEYRVFEAVAIEAIDLSNVGGAVDPRESEIVLRTRSKVPIHWGRAPWPNRFGEESVDTKVRNLRMVLTRHPGLRGLRAVRLQFHRPYIEPAVASR